MVCPKCGTNNPAESLFCGGCGSILRPDEAAANVAVPDAPVPAPVVPATPPVQSEPMLSAPAEQRSFPEAQAPQVQSAPSAEALGYGTPEAAPATPIFAVSNNAYPPQAPVPGTPGGFYPNQAASGFYPPQVSYPNQAASGFYPPQAPVPGTPSGFYPVQTPVPGLPGGVYPPQTSATDFPAGVYPNPVPGASYPGFQASGVYQPVYPGQQAPWGYPGGVPPTAPKQQSNLINPLPVWAFISSIVLVALVLVVLVFYTGSDWAAGAQTAGVVALVLGGILLIIFGVRSAVGLLAQTNAHRRGQIISSLLLALLLFAFGALGLTQQVGIHNTQGHILENQQNWQNAINEYEAAGQGQPASADIARTYNEWGEQLLKKQDYTNALGKFNTVMSNYTQASAQVTQAQNDAISTYISLGNLAVQQKVYTDATKYYDDLLNETYCNAPCQTQAGDRDSVAYYDLAEQALNAGNDSNAVAAFNQLTTRFGSSTSAKNAHNDYAKALFGEGQQDLTSACSNAVTIYKQLSTQFSDTPQGQQATTALTQPQGVNGTFTSTIPSGQNIPLVALVQGVTSSTTSDQFYAILQQSPSAQVQSNGSFTFTPLKQGTYDLVWGTDNQANGQVEFYVGTKSGTFQYIATVGPLCPYSFGNINQPFPTP